MALSPAHVEAVVRDARQQAATWQIPPNKALARIYAKGWITDAEYDAAIKILLPRSR